METILIQYATSKDLGTMEELEQRHRLEAEFDRALMSRGLGTCDGGQQGAGSAEIFCEVNNIAEALTVITEICEIHKLSRLIACLDTKEEKWVVIEPAGGVVSFFGWNTDSEVSN